ncbi:EF-hand domain-containing protein [Pseudomonas sp. NA-150]|uniref:EF-hand domain-containing protein n=1 Tax=Pseudomonas sp. NA-150 TaxID=3367525 RepID=UPI0037C72D30
MTVIPGELKSAIPLTEAWGPQMFFQADTSKNEKLTSTEFADQLKRIGVSAETASKLFKTFDTSKDGKLSVDEYVAGIRSVSSGGNTMFSDLMNSYIRSPNGQIDSTAEDNFLKQGNALATKYWANHS